jgi:hypothetical protein
MSPAPLTSYASKLPKNPGKPEIPRSRCAARCGHLNSDTALREAVQPLRPRLPHVQSACELPRTIINRGGILDAAGFGDISDTVANWKSMRLGTEETKLARKALH